MVANIKESDITSVLDVLQLDFLTMGAVVPKFEEIVSNFCNQNYTVSVNRPISELHIALMLLEVDPVSLYWKSGNNFNNKFILEDKEFKKLNITNWYLKSFRK
tara:strand:- start:221 stop:529 length:309 start_codon:yes stop_codon:yes gene_type:complete